MTNKLIASIKNTTGQVFYFGVYNWDVTAYLNSASKHQKCKWVSHPLSVSDVFWMWCKYVELILLPACLLLCQLGSWIWSCSTSTRDTDSCWKTVCIRLTHHCHGMLNLTWSLYSLTWQCPLKENKAFTGHRWWHMDLDTSADTRAKLSVF